MLAAAAAVLIVSGFTRTSLIMFEALSAQGGSTSRDDWNIPAGAAREQNPLTPSPEGLRDGLKTFQNKCQRCHGRTGIGNGPDASPEQPAGNLTDPIRAGFNPDGVMFYKIWNGREKPKMPAFRLEGMSRDEVWTVINYVKTLRK
jgi:mono/diheme cytochrome c family protein